MKKVVVAVASLLSAFVLLSGVQMTARPTWFIKKVKKKLPGLDAYAAEPALYLDTDFPGRNGMPTQFAYKKHKVNLNGVSVAYVEMGEGLPIVFVHGNPSYSYLWRNVMPHVSEQGRAIALDLPGFGNSDHDFPDFTFAFAAQVFEDFVKELNLTEMVMVLHDWGGAVVTTYMEKNFGHHKVIGLVLMETIIGTMAPLDELSPEALEVQTTFLDTVSSCAIGDAAYERLYTNLFMPNHFMKDSSVWPWPNELVSAYLQPFAEEATMADRFVTFKMAQCAPQPEMIEKCPLYPECRREVMRITECWPDYLKSGDIPKLMFVSDHGMFFPLRRKAEFLTYKNVKVITLEGASHYVQEAQGHRVGIYIGHWLGATGLSPLPY